MEIILDWIQSHSVIVVFLSAVIVYWNVSRTRKANEKNDTEKFKRDLNLKTCDEVSEKIYELKSVYKRTRTLDRMFQYFLNDTLNLDKYNEFVWKLVIDEYTKLYDLLVYFELREIVLFKQRNMIEEIREISEQYNSKIWRIKNAPTGTTDQEIFSTIKDVQEVTEEMILKLDVFRKKIQNEYLGKIYYREI